MSSSPSLFKPCLDALIEPLFIFTSERNPVFANRAFLDLIGRTTLPEQAIMLWPQHFRHESLAGDFAAELLHKDGHTVLVRFLGTELGDGLYLLKVISAQRKADQHSLFHSQRLETLGLLSGAVAHDFNNVLTGILGHATYLRAVLADNTQVAESLQAIEDGIKKGAAITAQVLQFSKVDVDDKNVQVSLRDVITKTLTLLRKAIPTRLTISTHYDVEDVSVLSSEGQLAQVLVNLVMNARDAIEDKGQLEISLAVERELQTLKEVLKTEEPACPCYAVLSVRDTGTGIEEALLQKIFEPFFTTKQDKGTGLGLYTIAEICKKLGGAIGVRSKVGAGTVVNVYLPAQNVSEQQEVSAAAPLETIARGTERILIVDDEMPIRNVLSVSLQHLGYKVTIAASALEALREIQKGGLSFDLIITDMLMPGMSGEEFFFEVRKEYPDAKFLVISGFSAQGSVERMLEAGARGFLPKPFTIEELSTFVRRCL
jgi:two-component system cell cycle sensor histidine kinase/response regulator CckA